VTVAPSDAAFQAFRARYPEFCATVTSVNYPELFAEVGALYCDNSDCSVIPCDEATYQPRMMLLNMLVAHLAAMSVGSAHGPASGLVGRIAGATQGSDSVTLAAYGKGSSASEAFFLQTPYGANFWRATAQYRVFQYVPPEPDYIDYAGGYPWRR
jgi:hypothetical protein